MKKLVLTLFCVLLVHIACGARNSFLNAGLEIACSVSEKNTALKEYSIFIFVDDTISDTIFAELALPIYVQLDLNRSYRLEFMKPGYMERVIILNTNVPEGKERKRFTYEFEINMHFHGNDTGLVAVAPVAVIQYDSLLGDFNYSTEYAQSTGNIPKMSVAPARREKKSATRKKAPKQVERKKL